MIQYHHSQFYESSLNTKLCRLIFTASHNLTANFSLYTLLDQLYWPHNFRIPSQHLSKTFIHLLLSRGYIFQINLLLFPKIIGSLQILIAMIDSNISENKDKKTGVGRWADDQHERFMMGITLYGKDWKKVEEVVRTRTGSQVRSHAQKFFNKLKKDQKRLKLPKKREQAQDQQISQSQNSFMKGIGDDVENTTPIQLVSLIKKQSQGGEKVNLVNLKKKLEDEMTIKEQQNEDDNSEQEGLFQLKRQNSYKSLNNILAAYENLKDANSNDFEEQSFLLKLTKRYKRYFQQGGSFESLIDFGNPDQLVDAHRSIRKRSFTLPEGVQGDQQDLDKRKKRIPTQNNATDLTQKELSAFQSAMSKYKEQGNPANPEQKIQKHQQIDNANSNQNSKEP